MQLISRLYLSAGRNVIMEGAIIPIWRQLFNIVHGTLVWRRRSDFEIELWRAGHYDNMASNANYRKRRLYSRRSSVLQTVLQNGYTDRNLWPHQGSSNNKASVISWILTTINNLTCSSTAQTTTLAIQLITCTLTGKYHRPMYIYSILFTLIN